MSEPPLYNDTTVLPPAELKCFSMHRTPVVLWTSSFETASVRLEYGSGFKRSSHIQHIHCADMFNASGAGGVAGAADSGAADTPVDLCYKGTSLMKPPPH